jgi:hypothetical protein
LSGLGLPLMMLFTSSMLLYRYSTCGVAPDSAIGGDLNASKVAGLLQLFTPGRYIPQDKQIYFLFQSTQ